MTVSDNVLCSIAKKQNDHWYFFRRIYTLQIVTFAELTPRRIALLIGSWNLSSFSTDFFGLTLILSASAEEGASLMYLQRR